MLLPETLKMHNRADFEFHYIYFLPWKNQMVNEIENQGGKVLCFSANNNLSLMLKVSNVVGYCKKNRIDLIHCHLPWAGFLGRLVHLRTDIPVFYTEHNLQERYHAITASLNKFSYNWQTLALGVSHDVSNSIEKNIKPKIPVRTVLNGVNTSSFRRKDRVSEVRKEFGIPKDSVVIGNVAVFRFQKRLKEWLQVFHEIKQKDNRVYGIIVGAGPLESEIFHEMKRLDLEASVFFPGLQTNVRPYYEAMDIFMMSSSFEGLPIALLEAMSMECAVVTTDAGGIKEVIRNGQDGLMCSKDEWRNLKKLALELIEDSRKLESFKGAARKRVKENFSLQTMVQELENYYCSYTV